MDRRGFLLGSAALALAPRIGLVALVLFYGTFSFLSIRTLL